MIPTHPMHEILRLGRLDEVVFELVRAIRFVDATPRAAICRRKQQHTHTLSLCLVLSSIGRTVEPSTGLDASLSAPKPVARDRRSGAGLDTPA